MTSICTLWRWSLYSNPAITRQKPGSGKKSRRTNKPGRSGIPLYEQRTSLSDERKQQERERKKPFGGSAMFGAAPVSQENKIKYWDQRGREGFSVGPSFQHYWCIQAIGSKTKALIITDTAEYLHKYLTQPHITAEDRMKHVIQLLTTALKDVPTSIHDSQLSAIEAAREIFTNGKTIKPTPHKTSKATLIPRQVAPARYQTPTSKGDQEN